MIYETEVVTNHVFHVVKGGRNVCVRGWSY